VARPNPLRPGCQAHRPSSHGAAALGSQARPPRPAPHKREAAPCVRALAAALHLLLRRRLAVGARTAAWLKTEPPAKLGVDLRIRSISLHLRRGWAHLRGPLVLLFRFLVSSVLLVARVAGAAVGQYLPVRRPWPAWGRRRVWRFCRLDPVVSCDYLGFSCVYAHLQENPYDY
jgi:hypothetical protein